LVNDISALPNLANTEGGFIQRVADLLHEGVELKVPAGELAPVFGLTFDEADTEHVGVNDEWLGFAEVRSTSRRDVDGEYRIRNLTRRLEVESVVTSSHPLVFGISYYRLVVDLELVAGSVELDGSLCEDSDSFSSDTEDHVPWSQAFKSSESLGGWYNCSERKRLARSSCSSSKDFLFSSGMELRSPR
jgi:hypothetical protein